MTQLGLRDGVELRQGQKGEQRISAGAAPLDALWALLSARENGVVGRAQCKPRPQGSMRSCVYERLGWSLSLKVTWTPGSKVGLEVQGSLPLC